ncbi:alpha/beta hydrolase fold domain-containing protein [Sphingomonas sp. HT-1]|uniref:alpha/beta hydrolase fold domain-containing protein n=1 Tax=unclassified Sphingomonas TaxID=196159 RepID=UPI00030C5F75|nr:MULTISPECIES: alpha/beta hydrolase fold domain-containing protein [unclassified Sphingomonas]KTF70160.1 alpha/beta hydrolase [Sphingomonas sp. WG]
MRTSRATIGAAMLLAWAAGGAAVNAQTAAPAVKVEADGTVQVPAMAVPVSPMLSLEAQRYVAEHLKAMQTPALLEQKNGVPVFLAPYIARQKQIYTTVRTERKIGGVQVYDYAPSQGIALANRNRVLINLHGGGFMGCFPGCAELESMPIAALGRIRVVSIDYRQGPAHRFPAASEDVASVYRALLKRYPAANIGIYGCSAGGMLTGMATAWFQRHALPRPGAIGVFCAGLTSSTNGFGGDADYLTAAVGEARAAPEWPRGASKPGSALPYLAGTDPEDPLVAPAVSEAVLKAFPPTLILTATRGFELSSAVKTHAELTRLGVPAELHVWEGLFHGFFYNPDVPESRDAYAVILRFFDRQLKR